LSQLQLRSQFADQRAKPSVSEPDRAIDGADTDEVDAEEVSGESVFSSVSSSNASLALKAAVSRFFMAIPTHLKNCYKTFGSLIVLLKTRGIPKSDKFALPKANISNGIRRKASIQFIGEKSYEKNLVDSFRRMLSTCREPCFCTGYHNQRLNRRARH
jgi:hypothetical protein